MSHSPRSLAPNGPGKETANTRVGPLESGVPVPEETPVKEKESEKETSTKTSSRNAADADDAESGAPKHKKTWRFWAIIASLSLTGLLSSIEGTIITSALPTIIAALGGGNLYIWVPNAYFLASIAGLPLISQSSDIFGRRWPLLLSVALFILGSGLCGGSNSMPMLIAARTVQGIGGGGIQLLSETVVTDLVPLRERGTYIALIMVAASIGAAIGPFIGGAMAGESTWRWVFYLNLPIGGLSLTLLFLFLRVNFERQQTWRQRLARVDVLGNAIFIASIVAVLIALTWGGTVYAWNTFHIVVPIVLGFIGLGLFLLYEWTICPEPSFPKEILAHRTSAGAFVLTLIHSLVTYWGFYFLPVYFQAVKGYSPFISGVDTLPVFAGIIPFAMIGGVALGKWGRYKPLHLLGFIIVTVAFGLFSLLNQNSSTAAWVCFQLLLAAGAGLLAGILLPAMQSPLNESLMAAATGVWAFGRLFGAVWGVTIPSALFNNECRKHAESIVTDPELVGYLTGGRAYEFATQAFLESIQDPSSRASVVEVFSRSMQTVWYVGIAFAGLGFLVTFVEREVKLRDKLETKFGIIEDDSKTEGNSDPPQGQPSQ